MKYQLLLFLLWIPFQENLFSQFSSQENHAIPDTDRIIFHKIIGKDRISGTENTGTLMLRIGESFAGTPYVAKTLESVPEQLVVNLHGLDCTTFVETCLAMTRLIQSGDTTMAQYQEILQDIRYRNGKLNGYTSRLHYFSEWIKDNEGKGFLKDVTGLCGGIPIRFQLNFMRTHAGEYQQLAADSTLIPLIREMETRISSESFLYIPKERLQDHENQIQDGDILAITTNIRGMDVAHTGLALHQNGRLYMLHASSVHHQVEVTGVPLFDYLSGIKYMTGIMVARPLAFSGKP